MLDKLREIITNYSEVDEENITGDTDLRVDLGLSSFDLVNIAVECEKVFGTNIPDRDLASMNSVGDMLDFIEQKI